MVLSHPHNFPETGTINHPSIEKIVQAQYQVTVRSSLLAWTFYML
jgi:hypothetical protein